MSTRNGGFDTADDWYEALVILASAHMVRNLIRDREAWTSNWQNEKPEEAFYNEYPEYEE
ncbi:MAG: hypothetical protein PHH47_13020 [Gallionella sp.]|nr:hypothetical protein [Gallionella sp.]MDD2722218.1 hypothetical protein [Gallionella sp.]MDD5612448.1 hypothetical protein [Gallionella sp.]